MEVRIYIYINLIYIYIYYIETSSLVDFPFFIYSSM